MPEQCAPEPECDGACARCTCGIPEYLARNLALTPLKTKGHSWQCQVWKSFPSSEKDKLPWGALWRHGLLPRNFHLCWEKADE